MFDVLTNKAGVKGMSCKFTTTLPRNVITPSNNKKTLGSSKPNSKHPVGCSLQGEIVFNRSCWSPDGSSTRDLEKVELPGRIASGPSNAEESDEGELRGGGFLEPLRLR